MKNRKVIAIVLAVIAVICVCLSMNMGGRNETGYEKHSISNTETEGQSDAFKTEITENVDKTNTEEAKDETIAG